MTLLIFFWCCFYFIFYTYLGYPVLLCFLSLLRHKKVEKEYIYPQVSVVIAVFNEEDNIKKRLGNLLDQDYPKDKLEIIVVSDGSTDRTEQIVESFAKDVKLYSFKMHRGKAEALNYGVSVARGDIIIFADARQSFKPDAIKQLSANFNDHSVGAASGRLFFTKDAQGNIKKPIDMYWVLEEWIRGKESEIDSVIGATGAIYGIRKSLYYPMPEETILDDVLIPMRIALKGFRVILDDSACAYDSSAIESGKEFKKKVRTLMGNFQLITFLPELLSIRRNRLFVNYISHKFMRLLVPYFLISAFVANIFLLKGIYFFAFLSQLIFYVVVLLGYLFRNNQKIFQYFSVPYTFVMLNFAAVLGFLNFVKKSQDIWEK